MSLQTISAAAKETDLLKGSDLSRCTKLLTGDATTFSEEVEQRFTSTDGTSRVSVTKEGPADLIGMDRLLAQKISEEEPHVGDMAVLDRTFVGQLFLAPFSVEVEI